MQGEFDGDEEGDEINVGTELTVNALGSLLTLYTSLTHLDLASNVMGNAEGRAIALGLAGCTHLTSLDLIVNEFSHNVTKKIKRAWKGEAGRIQL